MQYLPFATAKLLEGVNRHCLSWWVQGVVGNTEKVLSPLVSSHDKDIPSPFLFLNFFFFPLPSSPRRSQNVSTNEQCEKENLNSLDGRTGSLN